MILSKIGKQNVDDTSFITDESFLEYHKELDSADRKWHIKDYFPYTSNDFMDLLDGMLQYNPQFRSTASSLLRHKIFDPIRVPDYERPAPFKIDLEIYNQATFDYDKLSDRKYTIEVLKHMITEEVN